MSANRSVQAAQRRRAGPPEPQAPGRSGPQPSINSSQMFASQPRQGSAPRGPPQMQQQQQMQQQMQQQANGGVASVNKMTVAQAITLITLRLGAVETKMLELGTTGIVRSESQEGAMMIDTDVIESIMERLDTLEKRPVTSTNSGNNPDVLLLKQQFETVKQSVIQSKGISSTLVKENKELKSEIATLKNELNETKDLVIALQNLTMENNDRLLSFSAENLGQCDFNDNDNEHLDTTAIDFGLTNEEEQIVDNDTGNDNDNDNEFVGTNLKELIENEINESH
jgi:hypothetical protein